MHGGVKVLPQGLIGEPVRLRREKALPVLLHECLTAFAGRNEQGLNLRLKCGAFTLDETKQLGLSTDLK